MKEALNKTFVTVHKFMDKFLELGKFGGVLYVLSLLGEDPKDYLLWAVVLAYLFEAVFGVLSRKSEENK